MKIDNIQPKQTIVPQEKVESKNIATDSKGKPSNKAAIYEKSDIEEKGQVYNKDTIAELKRDSERAYGYLKRLVEDMLRRQGMSIDKLNSDDVVKVDEEARLEAESLIGEDGPLGVEAVSDRLVNFAKAVSNGDKSKLDSLKNAIDKG